MLHIKFRYKDSLSNWEWREQECIVESLEECKKIYGLGIDCEYELISVEGKCAYCDRYFKKKGNTKYCDVCRHNKIPMLLKNKKYEQSNKGKETRRLYNENKRQKNLYKIAISYKKDSKHLNSKLWVSYLTKDDSKHTLIREQGHYADILYDLIKYVKKSDLNNFMELGFPIENIKEVK